MQSILEFISVVIITFCVKKEYFRNDLYCKAHDLLKDGNPDSNKKPQIEELKLVNEGNAKREKKLEINSNIGNFLFKKF